MKSDIVIAQEAKMEPIMNIAKKLGVEEDDVDLYGNINVNYLWIY